MTKFTPQFTYYLTTRGLNDKGQILCLEYLPAWFHPHVTVVSVKANKAGILAKYPKVEYWSNPVEINTASLKRKFIFENSEPDDFFFLNDETRLYVEVGDGKARAAHSEPEHFRRHIKRIEELSKAYIGVAANQKYFSGDLLKKKDLLRENYVLGTFFHWNRKFVLKHIELDRVNYLDDVDYVLQALKLGYRVANYAGILYEHRTTVPQRQHNDRTVDIQERDTKRLLKLHPTSIFRKEGYDPVTSDIGVSVRFGPSYFPRRKVVFFCSDGRNKSAAAYTILMQLKRNFAIKTFGLVSEPNSVTDPKTVWALRKMGYPTNGHDVSPLTAKHLNWADDVFCFDKREKQLCLSKFPKVSPTKIRLLPNLIGEPAVVDYGMSDDKDVVLSACKKIEEMVKAWKGEGYPSISAQTVNEPHRSLF